MTPRKCLQIDQQLKAWRALHPDTASLQAVYRAKVLDFALNSMAMSGEPVDRNRVLALMARRPQQHDLTR